MRPFFLTIFWSLTFFGGVFSYSQLVANSRYLHNTNITLRAMTAAMKPIAAADQKVRLAEAHRRAKLYDDEILRDHLVDGMVVNRANNGEMQDQCDSLLFSSLRYVSLVKLGLGDRAQLAWKAIQNSRDNGNWLRHPRCYKSTSRDMLLGLLIAMSQEPPGFGEHLKALMELVDRHDGYFSTGPVYVSYLSPGLARFMAMLAPRGNLGGLKLPQIISSGYSTAELEVMVTEQGYESHLGGLSAWLEMEITSRGFAPPEPSGLLTQVLDGMISPFASWPLHRQRLDWITDQLVATDPDNLFYRYLRLRAAGALTTTMRSSLLGELLAMPHFPKDRLPANCDRHADYLWQRANRDANHLPWSCNTQFSGTDFLWMASLLLEDPPVPTDLSH